MADTHIVEFKNVRVIRVEGDVPHFVVKDILDIYPVNTKSEDYRDFAEKCVRRWSGVSPVEVVSFRDFSALVTLAFYQMSGDPELYDDFVRQMNAAPSF